MIRLIVSAMAVCALVSGHAFAQTACKLTPIGTATVAAVRDGRTLLLADGRTLRLAGIEVTDSQPRRVATAGRRQDAAAGKARPSLDRYGRLVAFAFAGASQESLQQALLAAGEARVAPYVGDRGCASLLLEAEGAARAGRRGLWADPRFSPIMADNLARLRAETGRFALVEGKVLSVHPSGGTIYLNFGRRWTRDFSVIILRRLRPRFAAAGIDPLRLEGRTRAGARLYRDAPRPDDRGRGAGADRVCATALRRLNKDK